MQFPSSDCHLSFPLPRSKETRQHPVPKHPQLHMCSRNVSNPVSHPPRTWGTLFFDTCLIYALSDSRREGELNGNSKRCPNSASCSFPHECTRNFYFLLPFPKNCNFSIFSHDLLTAFGQDGRRIGDWFPAGARYVSLLYSTQTASAAYQASYPVGTCALSPRGKAAGPLEWFISIYDIKNSWSYTSTSLHIFMA
jgi:hypothetical protein